MLQTTDGQMTDGRTMPYSKREKLISISLQLSGKTPWMPQKEEQLFVLSFMWSKVISYVQGTPMKADGYHC